MPGTKIRKARIHQGKAQPGGPGRRVSVFALMQYLKKTVPEAQKQQVKLPR